jgi:hypothetical protein
MRLVVLRIRSSLLEILDAEMPTHLLSALYIKAKMKSQIQIHGTAILSRSPQFRAMNVKRSMMNNHGSNNIFLISQTADSIIRPFFPNFFVDDLGLDRFRTK